MRPNGLRTRIFLDGADPGETSALLAHLGFLDGQTTNPTLIAKEKKGFRETIEEICAIVKGPVSAEVVAQDTEGILKEAKEIGSWADNIAIKIPISQAGMKATKQKRRPAEPYPVGS